MDDAILGMLNGKDVDQRVLAMEILAPQQETIEGIQRRADRYLDGRRPLFEARVAAACGLVVRTFQGRALKVEGNANNPVNLGKTCARGQATLHGLYNPDRVTGPLKRARGNASASPMG